MKPTSKILKFNLLSMSVIGLLIISSCSSSKYAAAPNDDVYYSRKDKQVTNTVPVAEQPAVNTTVNDGYQTTSVLKKSIPPSDENSKFDQKQRISSQQPENINQQANDTINRKPRYSNSETYTDENGNTYVTNNYYDDYYDYEYSSRLRRFHQPNPGYSYYDDYYTNLYNYNYDPFMWGTSIYMGYNWMWPSYSYFRPGWNFGIGLGFGYPYSGFAWDPFFYSSLYPYYYGYSPYGFYNYYDSPYYSYNSYDHNGSNGYHRGGRSPMSSFASNKTYRPSTYAATSVSFADKYNAYVASHNSNNKLAPSGNNINGLNTGNTSSQNNAVQNSMNLNKEQVLKNSNNAANSNSSANVSAPSFQAKPEMKFEKPNTNIKNNGFSAQKNISNNNLKSANNNVPVQKFSKPGQFQSINKSINKNNYYKPVPKYSKPKSYTSPGYSQPKSGQYYSKPNGYPSKQFLNNYRQNNSQKNNIINQNSSPKFDNRGNQGILKNFSAPSQNYSAPVKQNYSAPSPSINRSNTESRSSGSGSSGSGSNGGHRR